MRAILPSAMLQNLPTRVRRMLWRLSEMRYYSECTTRNTWDFSTGPNEMQRLGLTVSDCCFLVLAGWIECQFEEANSTAIDNISIIDSWCRSENARFILSEAGTAALTGHRFHVANGAARPGLSEPFVPADQRILDNYKTTPCWRPDRRALMFGYAVIKAFRWPAPNQELVLTVFEEEGWPLRIDDPLTPDYEQDPKRRLNDTVRCLNRKQCNPLVRFSSDGTGTGVLWEFAKANSERRQIIPVVPAL